MQYSLGHLLELLDSTLFNPFLSILIPVGLHILTRSKISIQASESSFFPYRLDSLPSLQSNALKLVLAGLLLRANRALSRRALNNGVEAQFDWNNEIILITGASGGIGAKAAQKFSKRGGKVVVLDVLPLTYPKPKNLYYYRCDLTDFDALQSVAAQIYRDVGKPTCVVANAGICRGKPILEASKHDIEITFGVNNLGLLWTAKTFLPSMAEKNHGHFLIIASQTGYLATAGVVDYAATKAAAIAIYEGLQTEMKHNYKAPAVRVSVISPSAVRTKMFAGIHSPSNFVLPRLMPTDVGDLICDVIWSGRAQSLLTPAFAYISTPSRCLPDWLRVAMQDGGAEVMTGLTPHKPMG